VQQLAQINTFTDFCLILSTLGSYPQGDAAEGNRLYQQLLQMPGHSEQSDALCNYAAYLVGTGDCEAAEKVYERVVEQDPLFLRAKIEFADYLHATGDFHGALMLLSTALVHDPHHVQVLYCLSTVLRAQPEQENALQQAEEFLQQALELLPQQSHRWEVAALEGKLCHDCARSAHHQHRHWDAEELFKRALAVYKTKCSNTDKTISLIERNLSAFKEECVMQCPACEQHCYCSQECKASHEEEHLLTCGQHAKADLRSTGQIQMQDMGVQLARRQIKKPQKGEEWGGKGHEHETFGEVCWVSSFNAIISTLNLSTLTSSLLSSVTSASAPWNQPQYQQRQNGWQPLHCAAMVGDVAKTKTLLASGCDPNVMNSVRDTPLDHALGSDTTTGTEVAKLLRASGGQRGADIMEAVGRTELHRAAMLWTTNRTHSVQYLLDQGADPNAVDDNGDTPLDLALLFNNSNSADLLKSMGGLRGPELRGEDTCAGTPSTPPCSMQ
jgi:hypothetical protein